MDLQQRAILTLLHSGITGQAGSLPEGFSLEEAIPMLQRHSVAALAYEGAVVCAVDRQSPAMQQLFQRYLRSLLTSEGQMKQLEKLFAALEEAGIDYVPLKGTLMKGRYPKPEHRSMGDADVLIRLEQYSRVEALLPTLGMTFQQESNHEYIWKNKSLYLEMHKMLIPSYNPDYYAYFRDGWNLARHHAGSRYLLPPEEEYVFLFTHMAKHYRDGGVGLRHILDLWVYARSQPGLDFEKIRAALRQLQLEEFWENIRALIRYWFEDGPSDDKLDFLTDYLFDSGSFGKWENHVLSQTLRDKKTAGSTGAGIRRGVLRTLFPGLEAMAGQFSVLKKLPWLLPVFWPVRMVRTLLFRRNRLQTAQHKLQTATAEKVDAFEQGLQYVGLDFHFEEPEHS